MKWKHPPSIKIYEALGCIADGRIDVDGNTATVRSSSGGKTYTITYDDKKNAIIANDNGSFWQGYLGYPSIAYLLATGRLVSDPVFAGALKDIPWKEVNVRFKNDYAKTETYVLERARERGFDTNELKREIAKIAIRIQELGLNQLGDRIKPPQGY
ncbi:MAG: hypothetical protein HY340_03870 [Candidatus Kerfeldbacteria bacterium]|nr:hypothetical protein [Candidatus Kerfeldbacteria bacterium]